MGGARRENREWAWLDRARGEWAGLNGEGGAWSRPMFLFAFGPHPRGSGLLRALCSEIQKSPQARGDRMVGVWLGLAAGQPCEANAPPHRYAIDGKRREWAGRAPWEGGA